MSATRLAFARTLLYEAEFQRGPQYEEVLVAIMASEDSTAHWNGMDTTLGAPGATWYNSFGPNGSEHVMNYASATSGVAATVATLRQPNMSPFSSLMRKSGQTAEQLARAFAKTPWQGLGDLLPLEIVQAYVAGHRSYVADRRNLVYGFGVWPYQANGEPNPVAPAKS